jgi:hypothetical protein
MPHKFDANTSNLVLMPKKSVVETTKIFFFLNHVLRKVGRTPEEPMERTHNIFYIYIYIYIYFVCRQWQVAT